MKVNLKNYFLYGGISQEQYRRIKAERNAYNGRAWKLLNLMMLVIFLVTFLLSFWMDSLAPKRYCYLGFALVYLVFLLLFLFFAKKHPVLVNILSAISILACFIGTAVLGTYGTDSVAVAYCAALVALPQLIICSPWEMVVIELASEAAFLILDFRFKSGDLLRLDVLNSVVFLFVSILIFVVVLQTRMNEMVLRKKMEEVGLKDEMSRLLSRNSFEEFMSDKKNVIPDEDVIYVSMDLNGLKQINDNQGHLAGDEQISAVGETARKHFSSVGNGYRTGGDEFILILRLSKSEYLSRIQAFTDELAGWKGKYTQGVSLSIGYCVKSEHPEIGSYEEMAKYADSIMLVHKMKYYESNGRDRRAQDSTFRTVLRTYLMVADINLTEDTFLVLHTDDPGACNGVLKGKLSEVHGAFADAGNVHPEDLAMFREKTSVNYLRNYFLSGKQTLNLFYRRTDGNTCRKTMMELVRKETYTDGFQSLYLYTKDVEE